MSRFEKLQVGNATLIALQDSWAPMKPGAFFGAVEDASWDPYRDLLKDDGTFVLNIGAWLVHTEGRTILVDTGIGARPVRMPLQEPAELPSVMQAAGVRTSDVDTIVLTHLHFDHTGWNTTDEGGVAKPLFSGARHVVQQAEWDYWTASDDLRQAAQYDNLLAPVEDAGLVDLIEGEQAITSELTAILTPGHTPGHMSFVLSSGGERAYLLGDAAHHPVQLSEPNWSPNADVDPALSSQTRAALFERIEREDALIASGHFDFPGLGHARRRDGTLRFEALEG